MSNIIIETRHYVEYIYKEKLYFVYIDAKNIKAAVLKFTNNYSFDEILCFRPLI